MGVNYGQILGMLLGTAGVTALGGHLKAKKLNDYEDTLNSNLTSQGAQPLGFKHHNFSFGDYGDMQTADQSLYKQALEAHQRTQKLGNQNTLGQQFGLPEFTDPDVAEKSLAPYQTQDASMRVPGQYGPRAASGALALQGLFNPNSGNPGQGQQPKMSPMFTSDSTGQSPTLNAGTSMSQLPPELEGQYITPAMVEKAQERQTTMRGQDVTSAGQKALDARERLKAIETQRHNHNTEQVQARNAATAEKRASIYARTAGLQGHSKDEQVYAAYKAGRIPEKEYKDYLLRSGGGDTESTSSTYDDEGNLVKTTTNSKSHGGSVGKPSAPGHSVDVGGGVQIRGF